MKPYIALASEPENVCSSVATRGKPLLFSVSAAWLVSDWMGSRASIWALILSVSALCTAGWWISGVTFSTYRLVFETWLAVHTASTEIGARMQPSTMSTVATGARQPTRRRGGWRGRRRLVFQLVDLGAELLELGPLVRGETGAHRGLPIWRVACVTADLRHQATSCGRDLNKPAAAGTCAPRLRVPLGGRLVYRVRASQAAASPGPGESWPGRPGRKFARIQPGSGIWANCCHCDSGHNMVRLGWLSQVRMRSAGSPLTGEAVTGLARHSPSRRKPPAGWRALLVRARKEAAGDHWR